MKQDFALDTSTKVPESGCVSTSRMRSMNSRPCGLHALLLSSTGDSHQDTAKTLFREPRSRLTSNNSEKIR